MITFTFDGKSLPSWVIVENYSKSLLPNISQNTTKINGRSGVIDFGNEISERNIEVAISIVSDSHSDLQAKMRTLTGLLYTEEPKKLVFTDNPNVYYMAKLTGDTSVENDIDLGKTTITFFLADPYGYSEEREFTMETATSEFNGIINRGNHTTYPRFRFQFQQPTTHFQLIANNEYMEFGQPVNITNQTPKNTEVTRIWDEMVSTSNWTSGIAVDGGDITGGGFVSNGYAFRVEDFGESNRWHGSAGVRSLSTPIKDFRVDCEYSFTASSAQELGRIEVYLFAEDGSVLGKMGMNDFYNTGFIPKAEARAGYLSGGHYFVNDYGAYKGVWKNFNYGMMRIGRKDNLWFAYFTIIDYSTYRHHTQLYREWRDTSRTWNKRLGSIQIHIGAHSTHPPMSGMRIQDIKVIEYVNASSSEVPYIFRAGDILEIDSESAGIWLNGEPYYDTLDPASRFIKLEKGANQLYSTSNVLVDGTVKFKERW